jgi:aerobic carbon-monoxide dehydrogenase small subunit
MLKTDSRSRAAMKARARVVSLCVNGDWSELAVKARTTLVETLREHLGLTGTKASCESGTCGACTVLVDGRPVLGCITLAVECDGSEVRTVEDLAQGDKLSPLQEAFLDHGAVQCGFCTSGMLMSATALLERDPQPGRESINKALEGNLCRCTGYNGIVDAILAASGQAIKPPRK